MLPIGMGCGVRGAKLAGWRVVWLLGELGWGALVYVGGDGCGSPLFRGAEFGKR